MKRRIPVFLVLSSLLLALMSAGAWVRSLYADDVWVFEPRPVASAEGWWWYRAAGSVGGRLALAEYAEVTIRTVNAGRQSPVPALTFDKRILVRPEHGEVSDLTLPLGVVEWRSARQGFGRRWFLAVDWRLLVAVFAVAPAVWLWRRWRLRHPAPAFPVVASDRAAEYPSAR